MSETLSVNHPLALIGPSGCGKSTVVQELVLSGLVDLTPSWTDRPRRGTEPDAEHRFTDSLHFDKLALGGVFLEVVQPFDLPYRYGLPAITTKADRVSLIMLRAFFVPLFIKHYPNGVVYQLEASKEFAKQQLLKRDDQELGTRLTVFEEERLLGRGYARRIFINQGQPLAELVNEVAKAIADDYYLEANNT